ncbi:ABC transporter ATP-binding protein [Bacillus sp. 2205SS5-2]|uniref:ABC transporter ATP-binding protein n=1 Tax=Bacillus sp. 2205SS5-2 TaxID=3109031 RepID=UPI0030068D3C
MRRILSYLTSYKKSVSIALSLMMFELVVELTQPFLMGLIIDQGILKGDMKAVSFWGGILLVLSLLAFVSGIVNTFYAAQVSQGVGFDLRKDLFAKTQEFSLNTFKHFPPSTLITRITNDVNSIQILLFMGLRIMLRAPLFIIGSLLMAFFVYPRLAVLLLISVPILLGIFLWVLKRGVHLFQHVQESIDGVNTTIRENLMAIKLIKSYNRGKYEKDRFETVNRSLLMNNTKALKVMELSMPMVMVGMNLILVGLIGFGSFEIEQGNGETGEMVAVINYGMRILFSFSVFSFLIMNYSRAKASGNRINEILQVNPVKSVRKSETIESIESLSFKNVSYRDEITNVNVLQNLSFEIAEGEFIGIMGATGAGKTTLLQLIPRLYAHNEGDIYVNSKPIAAYTDKDLRGIIAVVPQEAHLFSGTIRENLLWGKSNATFAEMKQAAEDAQIHDFILSLPRGYDSVVGQRGVNLSGGQKQRLSIARALIRRPSLLILDDSTSALDAETENNLLLALKSYACTLIMVAQKVSTIQNSDQILLLQNGEIVGKGKHQQLLESNKLYISINDSQREKERSRYV